MKSLTIRDLETILRPGLRIFVGGGSACPRALLEMAKPLVRKLYDLEVVHGPIVGSMPWDDEECAAALILTSLGVGVNGSDFLPVRPSETPSLFREGWMPLHVAIIMVTPPDPLGYCSLGLQVDSNLAACHRADIVLAQVNPEMPRTSGSGFLHQSRITYKLDASEAPEQSVSPEPDSILSRIGTNAAEWISDGATLHATNDPVSQAVLMKLDKHRKLGIHTDTFSDAMRLLLETGAVDNSQKTEFRGQSVATRCIGSDRLYAFVRDNPHIVFHPIEQVCDPRTIARQVNITCIHSPIAVSLSGEAFLRTGDDFILGAELQSDGMIIACLRSTDSVTATSTVLPELLGHGNSYFPDAIVTEYGAALLKGRSFREKCQEILRIVHPDHRESLVREAQSRNLLPSYWSLPTPYDPIRGAFRDRKIHLRDGTYLLRLLTPADEDRLQEFFYSHTEETVHRRYGFTLRRMTRQRAFELVSVNQNRDLALGVFETHGPRQILHAVGRYYLDASGTKAEVAFVTRENMRRAGMARALLTALIETARARNLKELWAQVDHGNIPMLKLFHSFNASCSMSADQDSSLISVQVPLREK